MKTIHYISLLLFSVYSNNFSSAAESPPPVLDITGKNLRAGNKYYILPAIPDRGGGLTLATTGNKTCPLDVFQDRHGINPGLPLTFTSVNPKKGLIRELTDLNVKFSGSSQICVQSNLWKLIYDEPKRQYFIGTGGIEGNPGMKTTSNWFKIEKYDESDDYKLVFCPMVCKFCKVICRDIGIFIEDGVRRLALSDVPFRVMLKRA